MPRRRLPVLSASAAWQATRTIPMVFATANDPVREGFVVSLGRLLDPADPAGRLAQQEFAPGITIPQSILLRPDRVIE